MPAGIWQGTVSGGVEGDLTTVLRELRVTGAIWHVRFDRILAAGEHSFTADLRRIRNTMTGAVAMSAGVVEGYHPGARVSSRGASTGSGTLPGSATSASGVQAASTGDAATIVCGSPGGV